jgi:hypothetical protein
MTKNWDIFPKGQPVGEDLANFSAYKIYEKFALAGYGVISGCVVSRYSSSQVNVASGVYTVSGVTRNFSGGSLSGIVVAGAGKQRYDLVYIDGTDDTLKILSGVEGTPDSALDFLENYTPRPAEPTDTDWIILAVVRVTENGIENSNFGTNSYATGSVAHMRMSPPFAVDDITLQVVNGVVSVKSAASTKLDDLATPDDNTDLNASTAAHGLLPKLSNSSTQFLNGQGAWATPSHTSLSNIGTNTHAQIDTFIASKAAASGIASLNSSSKVVQDPANSTSTPASGKIPIAESSGFLAAAWTKVSIYGPYRVTHDGGATQALFTTPAFCDVLGIAVKCVEASATRTVNIGWAADTDALMENASVPKVLNSKKMRRNPIDEIASATPLIATVGGTGTTGEWDVWVVILNFV